jgi:hypothetical protein
MDVSWEVWHLLVTCGSPSSPSNAMPLHVLIQPGSPSEHRVQGRGYLFALGLLFNRVQHERGEGSFLMAAVTPETSGDKNHTVHPGEGLERCVLGGVTSLHLQPQGPGSALSGPFFSCCTPWIWLLLSTLVPCSAKADVVTCGSDTQVRKVGGARHGRSCL